MLDLHIFILAISLCWGSVFLKLCKSLPKGTNSEACHHVVVSWLRQLVADLRGLVQSQASSSGIFGGQSGIGTGSSLSTLVFHCWHHSTQCSTPILSSVTDAESWQLRALFNNIPNEMKILFCRTQ